MKQLRILHIISGLETGGAETSLARLVLATPDVEHVVVSLMGMGTQGPLLIEAGVAVHAMNWRRGRISLRGLREILAMAKSMGPDVIQGWMYHANIIATIVALACGKRRALVWSVRHSLDDWAHEPRALRWVVRLNSWLSRLPATVLFNSERSRTQHVAYGFAARNAVTIANGVDTARFTPDAARRDLVRRELGIDRHVPVIGMVARVHPLKGHALLLDAVVCLRKHVPDLQVLLAGRGTSDDDGSVAVRARELGIDDIVHRLGDRADTEAIYNACDLTILASSSEAFPNTVAESMACGVPCIVTDVGDAALIVNNDAMVVRHRDPSEIAAAIAAACAAAFARLSRTRAESSFAVRQRVIGAFSMQRSTIRYRQLWNGLAAPAAHRDSRKSDSSHRDTPELSLQSGYPRKVLHVLTASMSLHFLRGQREWFAERGIELHVACSPGRELDEWDSSCPGTAHAIPMRRAISPLSDLRALAQLVRLIRRHQFDVVHAGTPKGGLLGTFASWLCRTPVRVYHVRGLPLATARGLSRKLLAVTERISVRAATRVIAVSDSLRTEIAVEGIAPARAIRVIGAGSSNGVEAQGRFDSALIADETVDALRSRHGIGPDKIVIGFVGRFTRDKGIAELLSAWRTVRSTHADAHLLIVGDADDASQETAQVLGAFRADPRVHLHGADWNTPPLYAMMDVLVLPTYREGFPNVLLEAASMRIPVVATSVAGCVDAVQHGTTGLIVAPRDSSALAAAISRYIAEPTLRHTHGEAARLRVLHQFDQSVIWNGLLKLYTTGDVADAELPVNHTARRRAA